MPLRTYSLRLEHPVSTSFRCQRAADALDIDTAKKSVHEFAVDADLDTPYNVGLILGASGSGKTTLARHIFGEEALTGTLDLGSPVIEQFPAAWSYDQCAAALAGMGLTSVPCWIRPAYTLSNGQRARAEAALLMARESEQPAVVDEWTSVVDRTVAKAMSHCLQKHVRRTKGRVILLSCHYDVVDWLNPDWIIDCNVGAFADRRSLWRSCDRAERLTFDVHPADRRSWRAFGAHHYLSGNLPGGRTFCYGLFHGAGQMGFGCVAQYTPPQKGQLEIYHTSRLVVHPDYQGLGLGVRFSNAIAEHFTRGRGVRLLTKFSAIPMMRAYTKDPGWRVLKEERLIGRQRARGHAARPVGRAAAGRTNVRTFTFEYVGPGSLYAAA